MAECMLSTKDNPFNPFTEFEQWYRFDQDYGYFCCELLGRNSFTSHELSEKDYEEKVESAIDQIVSDEFLNASKNYIKVSKDDNENKNKLVPNSSLS